MFRLPGGPDHRRSGWRTWAVTSDASFDVIQTIGDLTGQFEESCIEGVNLGQLLLVDLNCIEEAGIAVGGILDPVGKSAQFQGNVVNIIEKVKLTGLGNILLNVRCARSARCI